ncbi:chemotaxis protein, partial [Aliarcobacter trophiarum]
MLKNFSTRIKLFLFPILFVLIVFGSGIVYKYFSNIANERNNIAIITEELVQQNLKGRISVYQFLRNSSEDSKQNVLNHFEELKKDNHNLKIILFEEKNKNLSDEILNFLNEYILEFNSLSKDKIYNLENGITIESDEIKNRISKMVNIGLELEEKIFEINKGAIELRDEAYITLDTDLILLAVVTIIIFIIISILISNSIVNSINRFKDGLLGFFAYLNREEKDSELLDDSSKDEFGQM